MYSNLVLRACAFAALASAAFSLPECNVLDFGAKGDNSTEDTEAVQAAVNNCSLVQFPAPGKYLIRPINVGLHDNLTLQVDSGATIVGWSDPQTYNTTHAIYPLLWTDGWRNDSRVPMTNLTITGGGTIDGQGWRWWPYLKTRPRPILINIAIAQHLIISNVTLLDSPSFHIQIRGDDLVVSHVNISAGNCSGWLAAPNTDGINIGGSRIRISDSHVRNGDDCIPTNVNWDGSDTYDVVVERVHCECGTNGGVPIVAAGGTVRDVLYADMTVVGTNQGAGMKISEAYENVTGQVINVTWRNVTISQPRYAAMYVNVFQEDAGHCLSTYPTNASRPHWLTATNLSFEGVTAIVNSSAGAAAGCFLCSPARPCSGISFKDVVVTDTSGSAPPYYCRNIGVVDGGGSAPPPCGV